MKSLAVTFTFSLYNTVCPIRYRTRHFFNNFTNNEDIATTTDTFLPISHTTNVLLFKFRCNIFISVRIIKEMPGSAASGTHCMSRSLLWQCNKNGPYFNKRSFNRYAYACRKIKSSTVFSSSFDIDSKYEGLPSYPGIRGYSTILILGVRFAFLFLFFFCKRNNKMLEI